MKKAPEKNESLIVRHIPYGEIEVIRPLFRQVFGSDISESMLAWKYGQDEGVSYGAFLGDSLLAHCGVFYRSVLAEGRQRRIGQLGDLMALPGSYGGLSRKKSPFALLIQQVLAELPSETNPDGLGFGFPSDRAMRLGERLGLFASIDQIWQLTFSPLSLSWFSDRCKTLQPSNGDFFAVVNDLWQKMADKLGGDLIGVRDAAYLLRRYFRHPLNHYKCYLVTSRWRGRPLGVFILRLNGGQCELMDIIAHPDMIPRVLRTARQQLKSWGLDAMNLWLTEYHAKALHGLAQSCQKMEFRIMANPFSFGGKPEHFAHRWWLTSGDTDYR